MNEFQRTITRLLNKAPLVPVVVETKDNERVIIDMPEQVEFTLSGIRVTGNRRPKVFIEFSHIAKVMTLADLPAEPGGMSYAEYYEAMRSKLRAVPFRPFVIEFSSGKSLLVESPTMTLAGRFASYTPPDPAGIVRFTYDMVARVATPDAATVG